MCSRYGESLWTIGCGNDHAVAVGLLDETLMPLYQTGLMPVKFLIPLYRTEISGGKKGWCQRIGRNHRELSK